MSKPPINVHAEAGMCREPNVGSIRYLLLASVELEGHEAGLGLRLALPNGAEIYVTILTGFGLGYLWHYGRALNAMEQVIGIMPVTIAFGLLAGKALFSPWGAGIGAGVPG